MNRIPLYDKVLFWGWDKLSILGDEPYTSLSRRLFLVTFLVCLFPLWIRFVYLTVLPIWFLKKYEIRRYKWLLYVIAIVPLFVYITSTGFTDLFDTVCNYILVFVVVTTVGAFFNKKIVPKLAQSLAEMAQFRQDSEK